jgi:signal transduction histidine kinase/FixJ family two-component response regulator
VLNLSIKGKLTLIIMGATLVALLLVSAGFVGYELVTFQSTTRQDLSSLAELIALQSAGPLARGDERDGRALLGVLSAKKHIQAACLYKGAKPFAIYFAPGQSIDPVPVRPEPDGCRFGDRQVELFKGIESRGASLGAVYLRSDLLEKRSRLQLCAAMITLSILVSTIVTFLLSAWLQRIISRPISHLAETARLVSTQKNYSVRAEKHSNDELGQLIDGFNEMLEQIQQGAAALQAANDQLEQRVQERTQDLQLQIGEREHAEVALQEQFTRTNLLNQITQVISERQDLESILYVVLRQLEDFLSLDLGLVCLFDRGADTLNIAALRVKNPLLAPKLGFREGVVMSLEQAGLRMCKHGEVVHMPDTFKIHAHLAEHLASAGFRSTAAVPLMVENKLFGVLIAARLNPDAISSSECEFLHTLSDHVALAAHRAQLHTELEHAYNELRQTQNTVMQQERLKALGQMASGIAHDVNNALSPIVGFADLLSKSEPNLSANGQKYLQFIRTAGDDIAHIVARLREFYRQRNDRETLAALNLNELARQVIDMTRPRWRDIPQGRGLMIEMHTDFDANLPELAGIESEAREALTNLIINAVDAIPGGGTITVRTRAGLRDHSDRGPGTPSHVVLEVHDTGVGMDENTRKHCLEPFFSTKGQRGTGLGLAMVYGVMERHEGRIEIESEVGKGTTVKLIFPVRRLAGPGALEPARQETFHPLHILCIDDEPLLRELMREVLEREGHKVEVCDSGQGGVSAFRSATSHGRPFDVVFTDLGMPYFDGRQVAKVLKRESPATPVIMLTGWGAFMKEDGEVPPQVDGILSKPPRSSEIRETLERVMRRPTSAPDPRAGTNVNRPTTATA